MQKSPEARAFARLADHADRTVHHLGQIADNRQPQAGTAKFPGGGTVGLTEWQKQQSLLFLGNTDPLIANLEAENSGISFDFDLCISNFANFRSGFEFNSAGVQLGVFQSKKFCHFLYLRLKKVNHTCG